MNVLMIGSEALPFAKSGGLGDVLGALPKELKKQGAEVAVILPLYETVHEKYKKKMVRIAEFETQLAWRKKYVGLLKLVHEGVDFYFIDNQEYFNREKYYGYFDDGERFSYFCKACMDVIPLLAMKPDILHCSEWQTALIPVYLRTIYRNAQGYENIKTVFTIHNIEYQGQYDLRLLTDMFGIDKRDQSVLDYQGCINLTKGAIATCDLLTTVSPSYAQEIQYLFYGKGLDSIIKENAYKLRGILNGIDQNLFNPKKDPNLTAKYDAKTVEGGKALNKAAIQRELGLNEDENIVIVSMVTRLVEHKGIDLVIEAFDAMMQENIQFILLGAGDQQYEYFFREKERAYPKRVCFYRGYSEGLANKIYAGSDLFLMPSISEPCGLSQMIAAKYGTIPIVRETGGLKDSIEAFNPETGKGNGVTFKQVNWCDMLGAIQRAIGIYNDPVNHKKIINNALKSDFSWKKGAKEYLTLYNELYL